MSSMCLSGARANAQHDLFLLAAPADVDSKAKDVALPAPSTLGCSTTSPGWHRDGRHWVRREDGALRIRGYAGQAGDRAVRGGKDTVK